jgi:uncharacterized protein YcbK (DUF882 family)
MISLEELNPHSYPTTAEIGKNLSDLQIAINKVRSAWGTPMIVTSGLRSQADQARINPSAPKSNHLIGAAVDISDPSGALNKWCKANEAILSGAGLWCEERQGGWQHFQIFPPKSGHRWFNP